MNGIAEMFAELDGYGRYESALEWWGAERTAKARERYVARERVRTPHEELRRRDREYARTRYQSDSEHRERKKADALRRYYEKRDGSAQPRPLKPAAMHGDVRKYWSGCRCSACRAAYAEYWRGWYARREERRAA